MEVVEENLYLNKTFSEVDSSVKLYCPTEQKYSNYAYDYFFKHQFKYTSQIGKILGLNEANYYTKLMEYSISNMLIYPYHLTESYYNQSLKVEKIIPHHYYIQTIKRLLLEGLSFDRLPAYTARDVYRLLGIERNKFTEIANKYNSEKRKFVRKQPSIGDGIFPGLLLLQFISNTNKVRY